MQGTYLLTWGFVDLKGVSMNGWERFEHWVVHSAWVTGFLLLGAATMLGVMVVCLVRGEPL